MFLHRSKKESLYKDYELAINDLRYPHGKFELNDREIYLDDKTEIAHGGFKKIHDIGNGKVIAFTNYSAYIWIEAIEFELRKAAQLKNLV